MNQSHPAEQKTPATLFGFVGRYESTHDLLEAARLARKSGYKSVEAYSPFPVEGLSEIVGHKEHWIPWLMFAGGLIGCLGGFFMQYYANVIDDQLNIGGRPFNSWPAFIPITFELTVLIAAITGFVSFITRCKLPEVYHPIFNAPNIDRASLDSFFLCIMSDDEKFNLDEVRAFFTKTNPKEMHPVEV